MGVFWLEMKTMRFTVQSILTAIRLHSIAVGNPAAMATSKKLSFHVYHGWSLSTEVANSKQKVIHTEEWRHQHEAKVQTRKPWNQHTWAKLACWTIERYNCTIDYWPTVLSYRHISKRWIYYFVCVDSKTPAFDWLLARVSTESIAQPPGRRPKNSIHRIYIGRANSSLNSKKWAGIVSFFCVPQQPKNEAAWSNKEAAA